MSEPRTEAGRRLLDWLRTERNLMPREMPAAHRRVAAIEAEAVAAYKARLVEGVEGLTATFGQHTCWDNHEGGVDADGNPTLHADGSTCSDRIINESVLRAAVLRLIEEEAHRAE